MSFCYQSQTIVQEEPQSNSIFLGGVSMTTAVGTKFSAMSTKFQVGTAAIAIATAATLTPAIGHAAPNLSLIAEGVGNSISSTIDSVVVPKAAASASASASSTCPPGAVGCYLVEGLVAGTQAWVRGTTIYIGTVLYVIVEATGQILKAFPFLAPVADGVLAFANNIAQTFHVGPYLTGA